MTLTARFLEKTRRAPNGCLMWIGAVNANGYGSIFVDGKARTASRVAYELFVGPIPQDQCVCHRCDTPLCVEPAHFFLGTRGDNRRDCQRKGRAIGARGEKNAKARLTAAQAIEIAASDEPTIALVRRFHVNRTTIQRIRSGRSWGHAAC